MVLPNRSLVYLRDILAAPGWVTGDNATKKAKMVYLAGKMLCEVLPEPKDGPDDTPSPDFTLDPKMTEACKMAVTFMVESDRIPKGRYCNTLIETFHVLED